MSPCHLLGILAVVSWLCVSPVGAAQESAGSLRGAVEDGDFGVPLSGANVVILGTDLKAASSEQGSYVFGQVLPGVYTVVFTKEGYLREIRTNILVQGGQLTELNVPLRGDFKEMEEFIVQDVLQIGAGTESGLLIFRFEAPSFMDSIGADLMSSAGAGDAAAALRLVAGASVKDGKSAVIRGLPDRYVSSQLNGVRMPSADADKRAVELDQFPAAVIESIQVSKTFTPDQQGDASGGAVNVRLKGVPDQPLLQFKGQYSQNSRVAGRSDFLSYEGGGVGTLGKDHSRGIQEHHFGESWDGAVGTMLGDAPGESKWSVAGGGNQVLDNGLKLGGFASAFYERDASFFDDGVDDSYWVDTPGGAMEPERNQSQGSDDFKTALFDVTQGSQSVQVGGLMTLGVESENHSLNLTYLQSRTTEDTATLAEDTRGKSHFFPGHNPNDPLAEGNKSENQDTAPFLRLETLEYSERTTGSLQLDGGHKLGTRDFELGVLKFGQPEIDWVVSRNEATLDVPDKRQFGELWWGPRFIPGIPPYTADDVIPGLHLPYKPGANFTLGNLQRIWQEVDESGDQYSFNLKLPFEQWSGGHGYLKSGLFSDRVDRNFNQDTFSNFNDSGSYEAPWGMHWSEVFDDEDHPITAAETDVDYSGGQSIGAWYTMLDLPILPGLTLIGGARFETTSVRVVNDPEVDALWFPPGDSAPRRLAETPGAADVDFEEAVTLPSLGLIAEPFEKLTLRASYSQTVAHQTFKELTPIVQQEFLGGPIFIGNPELQMSDLKNYDLRMDYEPIKGGLLSASWFRKKIEDPIEYVQNVIGFTYTTAVNYPRGELSGYEFEARQSLGEIWKGLKGLSVGANATFLSTEVRLSDAEIEGFELPNIQAPMTTREMTNAPDHIYNFFFTYDFEPTSTSLGLFYTIQGDTLLAGAGQSAGNFIPSIYARDYDTLNLSLTQKMGKWFKLQLQAKNLTDPLIRTVYRSEYIGDDVTKTSFSRGVEYSISLTAEVPF